MNYGLGRLREQLKDTRQRAQKRGKSLLLTQGPTWHRFKNRRNVGGYTGLCPGVHQSNGKGYNAG